MNIFRKTKKQKTNKSKLFTRIFNTIHLIHSENDKYSCNLFSLSDAIRLKTLKINSNKAPVWTGAKLTCKVYANVSSISFIDGSH